MTALEEYLELEEQYLNICRLGGTEEDEDRVLELMDVVWLKMAQEERDYFNQERIFEDGKCITDESALKEYYKSQIEYFGKWPENAPTEESERKAWMDDYLNRIEES